MQLLHAYTDKAFIAGISDVNHRPNVRPEKMTTLRLSIKSGALGARDGEWGGQIEKSCCVITHVRVSGYWP